MIAPVVQHGATLGFAIHADYFLVSVLLVQPSVEQLYKLLHPVCKCQLINTVFHTAESRLGRHTVLQHAQSAEFLKIVSAKFYYLGSANTL